MAGYDGAYAGVAEDVDDPMSEHRVLVAVPDVLGSDQLWALPEQTDATLPAVGDELTVRFENGDLDHPIWSPGHLSETHPDATGGGDGYHATYTGLVLDTADPMAMQRVLLTVPEVGDQQVWATPEDSAAVLPSVGTYVWVRFEGGNADYPTWVGSGETAQTDDGPRQATVITAQDPGGLGRVYVQLDGQSDGVWASPAVPPPGDGEIVSIHFENGDAIWSR